MRDLSWWELLGLLAKMFVTFGFVLALSIIGFAAALAFKEVWIDRAKKKKDEELR